MNLKFFYSARFSGEKRDLASLMALRWSERLSGTLKLKQRTE